MPEPNLVMHLPLVALGGALGAGARYWVSGLVDRRIGELFPWGTLTVNVSGAFLLGFLGGMAAAGHVPPSPAWTFLAVGVLGSYTTVSSFSLQTLALLRNGEFRRAGLNVFLSFALCLPAAVLGYVSPVALLVRSWP
jgi:fluoride exporter